MICVARGVVRDISRDVANDMDTGQRCSKWRGYSDLASGVAS